MRNLYFLGQAQGRFCFPSSYKMVRHYFLKTLIQSFPCWACYSVPCYGRSVCDEEFNNLVKLLLRSSSLRNMRHSCKTHFKSTKSRISLSLTRFRAVLQGRLLNSTSTASMLVVPISVGTLSTVPKSVLSDKYLVTGTQMASQLSSQSKKWRIGM